MVRKQKFMILILIMVFLFSIIQIGHAFASIEKISLTNVEIINKSDTVYVDNITYENKEINNNITFHKVGDFVTYKITIKNNENKNYIIKSISDDNVNEYITYEYNTYEGVILGSNEEKQIYITAKYSKELNDVSRRDQSFLTKFSLNIEDEKGNSSNEEIKINSSNGNIEKNNEDSKKTIKATSTNPRTGDNIWIYILLAIISFISFLILLAKINNNSNKKGTKFFGLLILIALILPTISKADNVSLDIFMQNLFKIQDKLVINTQINGETISEIINYGDTLQKPENPEKAGYIFKGWYLDDGTEYDFNTPITEDLQINPKFEILNYDITYNLNGGTASNPISYTVEDEIVLNKPEKEGYLFTGWTGEGLAEKTENVTISKGSTGNRVYTANYEANTYTIVFNYNTGTGNMANQVMEYDIQESLKTNSFTKNGYKFVGWNTNPDGSGRSFGNEQQVKNLATGGMLTLYAQWSAIQYTVVFNSNGGTGTAMLNQEFCFDEEKNLSKNTYTNSGNIFIGWNTNADGTGTYYTDEKLVKNLTNQNGQTINLYAIWKKMSVGDYVNYNPASGFGNGLKFEDSSAKEGTSLSGTFNSNDITRWRVLNIKDNGEIQLVAEKPTTQEVSLSGANGYINGEKLLDDIGEIYGSGLGAVSGRSIKLEDIEHYFKYDKTTFSNSYSNTGKYGGVRKYTSGNFIVNDEIVSATSTSSVTVTQTAYWYDVDDYAYTKAENEDAYNAYKMLCKDIQVATGTNDTYTPYWISSRCAYLNPNGCWYYLHYIGDLHGVRKAELGTRGLYSSSGTESNASIGVLPVVTLHPSIDYTYNLENSAWDINYTPISYNIKFNSNGGEGTMQDQTFYLGEQKALSEKTFTRSGYVFNGWNTLADGSGTSYTDKQIVKNLKTENSNITLYAQWNEIELGETVTYNTSLNGVELNNWQIFYKNNDYVYLILKDYLPNSAIDDSLNVSKAQIYNVYGSNLYDVITTSSNWNNLLTGNINGKNIDYRNSQDSNIKATGSPTVDMFMQSWNEYYPDQALYLNNNETGYFIGTNSPATETELHFTDDYNHGSGFHFARWRDANNDGVTYGYWLASKSASSDAQSLLAAGFYIIQTPATVYNPEIASLKPGGQAFVAYARLGLRPVVCLPISVLQ